MKHATSRELYDYWDRLRRGQPAPHRGDIEPSDIRRILADTFILEVGDRETYMIRLAGKVPDIDLTATDLPIERPRG